MAVVAEAETDAAEGMLGLHGNDMEVDKANIFDPYSKNNTNDTTTDGCSKGSNINNTGPHATQKTRIE